MRYGLSDQQLKEIITIISSYPEVDEAIIFGSRAINTFKEASDVDIVIKGKTADSFLAVKIKSHLEDETYLPFFFDIISFESIDNDELKKHIKKHGEIIYKKHENSEQWQICKLKDIALKIGSGSTPKGGDNSYKTSGISLIRSQNILDYKFSYNGLAYIDETQAHKLKNVIVEKNDILLNITGDSVARCCIVNPKALPARVNQHVAIIRIDPKKSNSRFIFYYLQFLKDDLLSKSEIGATRRALTKEMLENTLMPLPSLNEQNRIAEILSSLDDKIDLLHRQNKTLESIAETLFRQWFIENENSKWEKISINDLAKLNMHTLNREYAYDEIQYLDTGSLTKGKIEQLQRLDLKNAPSRAKRLVKHNDIVISTVRPNQEHYGIIKNPINNLVVSTGFCVLTCEKYPHFLYMLLTQKEMTEYLHMIADASTSAYPSLKPEDIAKIDLYLPSETLLKKFETITSDQWGKIEKNNKKIIILKKTHDFLLPNLLNGYIKIER